MTPEQEKVFNREYDANHLYGSGLRADIAGLVNRVLSVPAPKVCYEWFREECESGIVWAECKVNGLIVGGYQSNPGRTHWRGEIKIPSHKSKAIDGREGDAQIYVEDAFASWQSGVMEAKG